jgi:hypothetical protein
MPKIKFSTIRQYGATPLAKIAQRSAYPQLKAFLTTAAPTSINF